MPVLFQSTHSLRSATLAHSGHRKRAVFQSTHSLRSATTADRLAQMVCDVSIHALLAECDILLHIRLGWPLQSFNPRTPCGVRLFLFPCTRTPTQFQSTHSLRSATQKNARLGQLEQVSIHALLAECDTETGEWSCSQLRFQSTHSLRSATEMDRRLYDKVAVSIHALLAECDRTRCQFSSARDGFNPRTPCGVRQSRVPHAVPIPCFNPRTPCGVRLRPTLYIATQQSKSYFAPTSLKRPSLHGCSF